jgi:hypothetical protein
MVLAALPFMGLASAPLAHSSPVGGPDVLVRQVSADPNNGSGEAYMVRNPLNPDQVALAWPANPDVSKSPTEVVFKAYCGLGVSHDGGRSWKTRKHAMALATYGGRTDPATVAGYTLAPPAPCGDAMIGVTPEGALVYVAAVLESPSFYQARTSYDWGFSWTDPVEVFGGRQSATGFGGDPTDGFSLGAGRPWMAVDAVTGQVAATEATDGSYDGRFLSVSEDAGLTWSPPRRVAPYLQLSGPPSVANGVVALTYSQDPPLPGGPGVACDATCLVFETTRDKGDTWDRHVIPTVRAPAGFPVGAITAADPSTPGRFAVLVPVVGGLEVWVTENSGDTWTLGSSVEASEGESVNKPWLAYSPNGALGAYWRTTHDDVTDVFVAVARDGVDGFSAPVAMATDTVGSATVVGADDCACSLFLDDSTVTASWADARSNTGQRETWFGSFDYRKLKPARDG